jgi:hypothetical protein
MISGSATSRVTAALTAKSNWIKALPDSRRRGARWHRCCALEGMASAIRVGKIVCLLAFLHGSGFRLAASQETSVALAERGRGADRIVVGRVSSVTPQWHVNEFGDRLIVSTVRVSVEETLKGDAQSAVAVEIEGGTIGGLTLHVSDLTTFVPGDRAVFYLRRNARGAFVPHLRGQGLLKLDTSNRVAGTNLTLAEVRRTIATGRQ